MIAKQELVNGDPVAKLVEASAEVGLLVTSSRGRGRIRSVLLGSLSRGLVHSAACPMVVVPRVGSTEASASVAGRLA